MNASPAESIAPQAASASPGQHPPATVGLSRKVHVGYALGSISTGAFATVPGLLLLPYLTDTLGVAAGVAALLVLIPKAWDVLVNPVAGRISDRTRSRWGARRPYLLFAGLALAVSFAAIFAAPVGNGDGAALYVALMFLATATAFAFYQVPYMAMPAEMTTDYAERTRLMTWRVAALALAILIAGAVSPIVVTAGGEGIPGHRLMGLFVAALIVVGAVGAFFGTRGTPTGAIEANEPSLRAQLAVATGNRPFRLLMLCFVVQSAGIATILAGVNYFADHILKSPELGATVMFACFVGPALVVMPVWIRVGARVGKARAFGISSVIFSVAALGLAAATVLPAALVYLVVAVMGCAYAGQQVFVLAMLPDCITYDELRTGKRQAGVFTGLFTAGETFGLALGPGIYGLVLQLSGYVSSSTGVAAEQSDSARLGVLLGVSVLPAVLVGVALLLLRGYDLTEQRLTEAQLRYSGAPGGKASSVHDR